MITALFIIMIMLCVRFTGFVIKMTGKLLGGALGILGYVFVGVIAIAVLKMAFKVIPIILVIGLLAIGYQMIKDRSAAI